MSNPITRTIGTVDGIFAHTIVDTSAGGGDAQNSIFSLVGNLNFIDGSDSWTSIYSSAISAELFLTGSAAMTIPRVQAIRTYPYITAAGITVTDLRGMTVGSPGSHAGSVTNYYGIYVEDYEHASNLSYAIYTEAPTQSYFGGNVGISDTTPDADLEIVNTFMVSATATGDGNLFIVQSDGKVGIGDLSPSATFEIIMDSEEAFDILNISSAAAEEDGDIMTILVDGNVGIGDREPSQELDLIGDLELETTTSNDTGVIYKGANAFFHDFHHPSGGTAIPDGNNIFVGTNAGNFTMGSTATSTDHASNNIAIGVVALNNNTLGYGNFAMGGFALYSNNAGSNNFAIGSSALYYNQTGSDNIAIGNYALRGASGQNGIRNIGIGYAALDTITSGYYNTAIGWGVHSANTSGFQNTSIGYQAGRYLANGSSVNQTANNSVYIGFNSRSDSSASSSNEIAIGASVIGEGSNSVVLGNDSITKTILKGNVGIGVVSPLSELDVRGGSYAINQDIGILFGTPSAANGWLGGIKVKSSGAGIVRLALEAPSGNGFLRNEVISIMASSNVGINDTSPDYPLEILSTTTPQFSITNTDATDYATFGVDTDGKLTITTVDGGGTAGNINLMPDGSVGVGETDFTDPIFGTSKFKVRDGGTVLFFNNHDSSNGQGWVGMTNGTITGYTGHLNTADGYVIGSYSNHNLALRTNNTNRVTITASGNVGISDTTPDAKLEILATTTQLMLTHTDNTDFATFTIDANGSLNIVTVDGGGAAGNIDIVSDGVTTIGDGGATNYAQFAADGELTLAGTARVIKEIIIGSASLHKGSSSPSDYYFSNTMHALNFDKTTVQHGHFSTIIPTDFATGTTIDVQVDWSFLDVEADHYMTWVLEYVLIADGEDPAKAITRTFQKTIISTGNNDKQIHTTFGTGITGAVADDVLLIKFYRDSDATYDTDDLNQDSKLLAIHLHYTADKLGEAM